MTRWRSPRRRPARPMKPNPVHRLPPALEAAVQRLRHTAREAVERSVESLGLAALGAQLARQRDTLLEAQFELNRKSAAFLLAFNDALDERILRDIGQPTEAPPSPAGGALPWESFSLVEDREVDLQIQAERFGMDVGRACEWELRELEPYLVRVLDSGDDAPLRNPLRPEQVGHATVRAIEALSVADDVRKLVVAELSRSMGALLRNTYAAMVSDFRRMGVTPANLSVRHRAAPAGATGAAAAGEPASPVSRSGGLDSRAPAESLSTSGRAHLGSSWAPVSGGRPMGHVDPAVMTLLRRLAQTDPGAAYDTLPAAEASLVGMPLANVIHAHRDALREASRGGTDHMVIDVIGFLFDQILADPKLAPQMARQIARLQLPVLRAALGDPSFFSSRRHPVRRFVNRIASLGAGFEGFDTEEGVAFLGKVAGVIDDVVSGDFDRLDLYERQLAELESFMAGQMASAGSDPGAALLQQKEDEALLRELYARQIDGELQQVQAPPFLREFLSRVWSRVLLKAQQPGGPGPETAERMRRLARELVLSVQPKSSPAHRKTFLAELPRLMQELTEGLNLIGWPEADRRTFFGQLMPAHAESLKAAAVRQLDLNLLARTLDGALARPAPDAASLPQARELPVLNEAVVEPQLSASEAAQVGLLDEARVDWSGQVDIDLGEPAPSSEPPAPGLPALQDVADPVRGRELASSLQVGFAYEMQIEGQWQKVRLTHVSPGRTFFMFKHGPRQRLSVSLTQRMLQRLCETGRLRAYEQATLLERATERARRQLASLGRSAAQAAQASGVGRPPAQPAPAT